MFFLQNQGEHIDTRFCPWSLSPINDKNLEADPILLTQSQQFEIPPQVSIL
jgi:hypothetical protein